MIRVVCAMGHFVFVHATQANVIHDLKRNSTIRIEIVGEDGSRLATFPPESVVAHGEASGGWEQTPQGHYIISADKDGGPHGPQDRTYIGERVKP